jgi:hypothetical protein
MGKASGDVHQRHLPANNDRFIIYYLSCMQCFLALLIFQRVETGSGWKIMPEDDNLNLKINAAILEQVMNHIRQDYVFSSKGFLN